MAYTVSTPKNIGLLGGETIAYVDVSPDSASATILSGSFPNAVEIEPLSMTFIEALDATCVGGSVVQNSSNKTTVDINLIEQDGTAATGYKDFRLLVKVQDSTY